jgi:hypothetical protein
MGAIGLITPTSISIDNCRLFEADFFQLDVSYVVDAYVLSSGKSMYVCTEQRHPEDPDFERHRLFLIKHVY